MTNWKVMEEPENVMVAPQPPPWDNVQKNRPFAGGGPGNKPPQALPPATIPEKKE